jgi:hypothetical protein
MARHCCRAVVFVRVGTIYSYAFYYCFTGTEGYGCDWGSTCGGGKGNRGKDRVGSNTDQNLMAGERIVIAGGKNNDHAI